MTGAVNRRYRSDPCVARTGRPNGGQIARRSAAMGARAAMTGLWAAPVNQLRMWFGGAIDSSAGERYSDRVLGKHDDEIHPRAQVLLEHSRNASGRDSVPGFIVAGGPLVALAERFAMGGLGERGAIGAALAAILLVGCPIWYATDAATKDRRYGPADWAELEAKPDL